MKKKYNVTGMGCAVCQSRIQTGISNLNGIKNCEVNLLTNSMVCEFDPSVITSADICSEVSKLGYGASEESDEEDPHPSEKVKELSLKTRLRLSIIISVPLFLICMMPTISAHLKYINVISLILCLLVIIINFRIYKSGITSLVHLAPNMDALVSIGTIASIVIGYYDSAAMILTIITLGKWLEERAKNRTTNALTDLMKLLPDTVSVIRDGVELKVKPSVLRVGEICICYPGESIGSDGIVVEGKSRVNNSMLTGESTPVEIEVGSTVTSGTINMDGYFKYQVTKTGKDTTLSKIIALVEEASSSKAPISRIADKVSLIFVPTVIGIAILTFLIWVIYYKVNGFSIDYPYILNFAISVLVISCPCALGLATPVSIMVGTGRGAKEGIIIKSATALENLGKVNTIVFDKTGTITKGIVSSEISLDERLKGDKTIVNTSLDEVKEDSKDVISKLNDMNINTVLLSGDKEENVKKISNLVGIKEYIYGVLPDGKANEIDRIKKENPNDILAMIGDGVNDAIAIKKADIGIAISTGTDIAINEADIVLMGDGLGGLLKAINLSKATIKNIKLSLFWAFFYNLICIPVAAGALVGIGIMLNPMICAALMSLSSITVTTNALRLRKIKIE